jgi:glycerophosphoryl diester phosphodiesterase
MKKKEIMILGHRGYSKKYLENSLISFKKAFFYKADGIECDLQKTKDNNFIIIHDESVDRVTSKTGRVNRFNLNQIKKIKLKNNQKIPLLTDMLKNMPKNKILNLEIKKETIKESDCPKITGILKKYIAKERLIISSFSYNLLDYFKKNFFIIGLLVPGKFNLIKLIFSLVKYKPDYINLPIRIFKTVGSLITNILLIIIKLFKIKILFWVVNSENEFNKASRFADVIITDDPEFIVKLKNKETARERERSREK